MALNKSIVNGDVMYNIEGMCVAALIDDVAGTYNDPTWVRYGGDISWSYDADTDEIKAYGKIVEKLTILTQASGTMNRGAIDYPTLAQMTGIESQSGSGYEQFDVTVGGSGLIYFGLIAKFSAKNGTKMVGGFAKAMLGTFPEFSMGQNTFRTDQTEFSAIAPSQSSNILWRGRTYASYGELPDNSADFAAFFAGFFDGS